MRRAAPSGDASAQHQTDDRMRQLYDLHAGPLLRYLLTFSFIGRQLAEDIVQETLERAWRHLDTLDPEVRALRPWLYTVARHLAIDTLRPLKARMAKDLHVDLAELAAPGDDIERMLTTETVRNALSTLSTDHREIVLELYYNGRTARETGELLGIPEGTVKSRAYYALRSLRASIGSLDGKTP